MFSFIVVVFFHAVCLLILQHIFAYILATFKVRLDSHSCILRRDNGVLGSDVEVNEKQIAAVSGRRLKMI